MLTVIIHKLDESCKTIFAYCCSPAAMLSQLAIGDSILTTSGFYGMVIDINDDQGTVIVEFGNNKNCRIPMNKTAIVQVEKPDAE